MMNRRDCLKASIGGLVAGGLFPFAFSRDGHAFGERSWKTQFEDAMQEKPWLLGFKGTDQRAYGSAATLISGALPPELRGTHYRNGPARHEIGGFRYQHWFDGDGLLNAFRFTDQGLNHQARMIETSKYKAEIAAGRALYPAFGTVPPDPASVISADSMNVANISVLPHHDKLLALWEAGSPYEIDPNTLETIGIYKFSEDTAGAPFSAHPRVEPDGTLWNFGYLSAAKRIVLWHLNARGKIIKARSIAVDPITMVHDFIVTQKHIVLLIPPLHFEPNGATTFLDAHVWVAEDPTRVLVIDKANLNVQKIYELPAQWVFHFGNAWEDNNGMIRFDAIRSENPSILYDGFRNVMRGKTLSALADGSHHYSYEIDTKRGSISETRILPAHIQSEFPTIDPRISGHRYQQVVTLTSNARMPAPHGMFTSVSRLNVQTGNEWSWNYPINQIPEEHLFVPKPGSAPETKGWVIGTSLNYLDAHTIFSIFDAEHLSDGPIAEYKLPYALPLGLHGKFT